MSLSLRFHFEKSMLLLVTRKSNISTEACSMHKYVQPRYLPTLANLFMGPIEIGSHHGNKNSIKNMAPMIFIIFISYSVNIIEYATRAHDQGHDKDLYKSSSKKWTALVSILPAIWTQRISESVRPSSTKWNRDMGIFSIIVDSTSTRLFPRYGGKKEFSEVRNPDRVFKSRMRGSREHILGSA